MTSTSTANHLQALATAFCTAAGLDPTTTLVEVTGTAGLIRVPVLRWPTGSSGTCSEHYRTFAVTEITHAVAALDDAAEAERRAVRPLSDVEQRALEAGWAAAARGERAEEAARAAREDCQAGRFGILKHPAGCNCRPTA